ncbi:MAG: PH domain-containing protein [Actinomycetota bacterium]|nr:PH domain-containing protein [Actinomycetota bacterium]
MAEVGPASTNQPRAPRWVRWWGALLLAVTTPLMAGAIFLGHSAPLERLVAAVFPAFLVWTFVDLIRAPFVLDAEGITIRQGRIRPRRVRWRDVAAVRETGRVRHPWVLELHDGRSVKLPDAAQHDLVTRKLRRHIRAGNHRPDPNG